MINPDIDLTEVGKCVFIYAKNFLISEHSGILMIIDLKVQNHFWNYSFHLIDFKVSFDIAGWNTYN